jgi:hypothetical protein
VCANLEFSIPPSALLKAKEAGGRGIKYKLKKLKIKNISRIKNMQQPSYVLVKWPVLLT